MDNLSILLFLKWHENNKLLYEENVFISANVAVKY